MLNHVTDPVEDPKFWEQKFSLLLYSVKPVFARVNQGNIQQLQKKAFFFFTSKICEIVVSFYLSSPQMILTCKIGTTKAAPRILAMTTASTI